MNDFFLALQFLTRLPIPVGVRFGPQAQGRSLIYYPVVGLLIGVLLWLLSCLPGHDFLTGALVLAAWVAITGALHLDGLADTADAWVGGAGDRERTLAIMKDPSSGPMGVAAINVLLLVKFAAVVSLLQSERGWLLILAPVLGRSAVIGILLATAYVREGGIAAAITTHLPRGSLLSVLLVVVVLLLLLLGDAGVLLLAVLTAVLMWLRYAFLHRIGGITGDTLGAVVEMTEVVTLAILVYSY